MKEEPAAPPAVDPEVFSPFPGATALPENPAETSDSLPQLAAISIALLLALITLLACA
jgi:hypothetical protein